MKFSVKPALCLVGDEKSQDISASVTLATDYNGMNVQVRACVS